MDMLCHPERSEGPAFCDELLIFPFDYAQDQDDKIMKRLLGRLQFAFQGFRIADHDAAAIDLNHSLRLQPRKIAGYELAHRADL